MYNYLVYYIVLIYANFALGFTIYIYIYTFALYFNCIMLKNYMLLIDFF